MAFSPEWPKGGLPISCNKHDVATIVPMSLATMGKLGYLRSMPAAAPSPRERPMVATSIECVSRVRTKSCGSKENTCALLRSLLKEELKTTLSKSFSKGVRASYSDRLVTRDFRRRSGETNSFQAVACLLATSALTILSFRHRCY